MGMDKGRVRERERETERERERGRSRGRERRYALLGYGGEWGVGTGCRG